MYEIERGILDASVAAALRKALKGNSTISEREIREILKSTLDGKGANRVNDNEYHDLMMILRKSRTITDVARSEMLAFIAKNYVLHGPYVSSRVSELEGKPKAFTGECAGIVQWYTRVGETKNWRQGITVRGNGATITKGTAVATFVDGFYPNLQHGNHAALYISQDAQGIQVMDQWNGTNKPTISSRLMVFKGKNSDGTFVDPSNNGDALSVIMTH